MFERFTDRARRVVVLAQEEARLFNHNYIGTEHILLGLIHESEGVAALALESLGISLEDVRAQVQEVIGHGAEAPAGHIPFTTRAKKVLELSLHEGIELGHNYIGTEHILLGLVREGHGVGAQVLERLGGDLSEIRATVIKLLSAGTGGAVGMRQTTGAMAAPGAVRGVFGGAVFRSAPSCSFCGRDLWEVDHYVAGAGAFMCDVCVADAHEALDDVADDTQVVMLPPRVFGDPPPDDPRALEAIAKTLNAVFAEPLSGETAGYLEDGEELVPILQAARDRHPGIDVTAVVVERVRFSTPIGASVGFRLIINNGARYSFIGAVKRVGERWVVTRATVADVLRAGGMSLPPAA